MANFIEIDKSVVLSGLIARAQADLEAMMASQRETQASATHEEAKPESDKDTRATESSYLARGLAKRVGELRSTIATLETLALRSFGSDSVIALSALVTLRDDSDFVSRYFIAPAGGGVTVLANGVAIAAVTPSSPLGSALIGRRIGDDVELRTPSGLRELTVVAVS